MELAAYDVENKSEGRLKITNKMGKRTDYISNLNHHMIDNVRLVAINDHTEESKVTLNESQEDLNKNSETLKEVKEIYKSSKGNLI